MVKTAILNTQFLIAFKVLFIYFKIVSVGLIRSLYDHVCAVPPRFYKRFPQRRAVPVGDIH